MNDGIIDWPNKCCAKCRKPLVYDTSLPQYEGWRLDCTCWDEKSPVSEKG